MDVQHSTDILVRTHDLRMLQGGMVSHHTGSSIVNEYKPCTHKHTQTHTHTCIHMQIHTHAHIHACACAHMHTSACAHTHTYIHTHIHTQTHTYLISSHLFSKRKAFRNGVGGGGVARFSNRKMTVRTFSGSVQHCAVHVLDRFR